MLAKGSEAKDARSYPKVQASSPLLLSLVLLSIYAYASPPGNLIATHLCHTQGVAQLHC